MVQVNFRMKEECLALIDRAAATQGITRTEFVLRSSEVTAIETLIERPVISLDDKAYDAFIAALDAPVEIECPVEKTVYPQTPVGTITVFRDANSNQQ